jgi:hypothetical protein
LIQEAIIETTINSEMAFAGDRGALAMRVSIRLMAGALASACPATSMSTIWKAKVKRLKTPAYHAAAICFGAALGAKKKASAAANSVSTMAKTNGSGINFSNRYTKTEVTRLSSEGRGLVEAGMADCTVSIIAVATSE